MVSPKFVPDQENTEQNSPSVATFKLVSFGLAVCEWLTVRETEALQAQRAEFII